MNRRGRDFCYSIADCKRTKSIRRSVPDVQNTFGKDKRVLRSRQRKYHRNTVNRTSIVGKNIRPYLARICLAIKYYIFTTKRAVLFGRFVSEIRRKKLFAGVWMVKQKPTNFYGFSLEALPRRIQSAQHEITSDTIFSTE